MASTLDRLRYIDQVNRAGRLGSILFDRVNGPQALIAALPDMIALIEACQTASPLPVSVAGPLDHLTRDR